MKTIWLHTHRNVIGKRRSVFRVFSDNCILLCYYTKDLWSTGAGAKGKRGKGGMTGNEQKISFWEEEEVKKLHGESCTTLQKH